MIKIWTLILVILVSTPKQGICQLNTIQSQVDSLKYIHSTTFDCNSVFWKIIANKEDAVPYLIDKMGDTTTTFALYKCKTGYLKTGDIAYLALEHIVPLPFFSVTGMQMCVYENGCQSGVFEYIEKNREKFRIQVKDWYNKNKKKLKWVKADMQNLNACEKANNIWGHFMLE